jgi:hypothetical protein
MLSLGFNALLCLKLVIHNLWHVLRVSSHNLSLTVNNVCCGNPINVVSAPPSI